VSKILVTGGCGFIGSMLVSRLRSQGHCVRVFDSAQDPVDTAKREDICNLREVCAAVKGKDAVFHLAAVADLNWARVHPIETMKINIEGTWNIAHACCSNGTKLYYASTCCFPPDSWVRTKDGVKNIGDIKIGDQVVTHTGETHTVTATGKRHHKGEVISVHAIGGLPITSTPEHPYLVKTDNDKKWVAARDLKPQDKIVIIAEKKREKYNGLEPEMAYLWGLYVAEGSLACNKDHYSVTFHLGDEPRLTELITNAMLTYYDKEAHIVSCSYLNQKGTRLTFYGKELAEEFHQFYDNGMPPCRATNKAIPTSVLDASPEARLEFLHGFIDGDGCCYKSLKAGNVITMSTVSAKLAWQLRAMFTDLGILAAMSFHPRSNTVLGRNVNGHQGYTLQIRGKDAFDLLNKFGIPGWEYTRTPQQRYTKDNGNIVAPIYKIDRTEYDGDVYNLEVETDNSYTVGGVAVHNCVYGPQKHHPVDETVLPNPAEIYACTKLAGENAIMGFHHTYGLKYIMMRFATIYGEGTRPALATHIFLGQALRGEPITIHGDGTQTRTLTHVNDLVDAMIAGYKSGKVNRIWNMTATEEISALRMANDILQVTGSKSPITFIPQRIGQTMRESIRADRIHAETGWSAKVSWHEGIQSMYRWFIQTRQANNKYVLPQ